MALEFHIFFVMFLPRFSLILGAGLVFAILNEWVLALSCFELLVSFSPMNLAEFQMGEKKKK